MKIEVSNGEIIDKLSILSLKLEKIKDLNKLRHIEAEFKQIQRDSKSLLNLLDMHPVEYYQQLHSVNSQLWDVEDRLRVLESKGDFEIEFILLARSVYRLNDLRSEVKKQINIATGSTLTEEKSYEKYQTQ